MTDPPEIQRYKDAVWDFLLEHCEILESGALFFKFHASHRRNFENRVIARWRYGYHREDPRAKEAEASERRAQFEAKKLDKASRWKHEKQRRRRLRAVLRFVKIKNRARMLVRDYLGI